MHRVWRARLRSAAGVAAALALAALAVAMPGWSSVTASASVDADQTWRLHTLGPGVWQWTLESGRSAVGPALVSERVVQFDREDVVELTLAPGLSSGSRISKGQVLATVRSGRAARQLDELRAERDRLEATRALLEAGGRAETIARAEQEVTVAQARRAEQLAILERLEQLKGTGALIEAELQTAELALRRIDEEIEVAKARLAEARFPPRREELDAVAAELASVEAGIAQMEALIGDDPMTSPIEGIADIGTLAPAVVAGGSEPPPSLVRVYDVDPVYVRVPIAEGARDGVEVGARVAFTSVGIPSREFEGQLVEVSEQASTGMDGRRVFWGVAEIPNPDLALRPGMTGQARLQSSSAIRRALASVWGLSKGPGDGS
jgi:multidrug efflux pump subunit AcrA (membrane-fusion protein)